MILKGRDLLLLVTSHLSLLLLALYPSFSTAAQWFPALSSNIDDDTFHYYSNVWFNSTPFNTQFPNTKNALFESYSTIYVEKIRITMDGTTDKSCGTQCTFTFSLPESYAGRFTLKELVTTDGGIDLKDDRDISWVRLINFFYFFFFFFDLSHPLFLCLFE
jgi:hypothetical protein